MIGVQFDDIEIAKLVPEHRVAWKHHIAHKGTRSHLIKRICPVGRSASGPATHSAKGRMSMQLTYNCGKYEC